MTQFYSYLWLRENGEPYYAGKGKGNRAFVRNGHCCHRPVDNSRILIFPMLDEADAFESEKTLIELFGRIDLGTGCLRNHTDGGEGTSGPISNHQRKRQNEGKLKRHPYFNGESESIMRERIQGKVFGRLTAVENLTTPINFFSNWICNCSCGNVTTVPSGRLIQGKQKSCGCFRSEWGRKRVRANFSKLSLEQAAEIKRLLSSGASKKQIAEKFGMHITTIRQIVRGEIWKDA